jgi:hypothetical protein
MRLPLSPAGGGSMTTQEEMHRIHNIAVRMLPGFKQAQAQMAVASHVMEYFARFPEYEISPGKHHPFDRAEPRLLKEIEELKSMLTAFSRIHETKR